MSVLMLDVPQCRRGLHKLRWFVGEGFSGRRCPDKFINESWSDFSVALANAAPSGTSDSISRAADTWSCFQQELSVRTYGLQQYFTRHSTHVSAISHVSGGHAGLQF